ncbi:MAG TPA: DUF3761 domain-containing protein [Nocardioidaceae bacterium]
MGVPSLKFLGFWLALAAGTLIIGGILGGVAMLFDSGGSDGSSSYSEQDEPSAVCEDGSVSYSQHDQGTCSWHGGVDHWLD